MTNRLLLTVAVFCFSRFNPASLAQQKSPKLIIGIVVDQMRVDFLYRYRYKFGKGGFNRLISEGYDNKNTYFPYVPTYTAPGHSSIFSGSIPAISGIVGNDWYSRELGRNVYCTDDSLAHAVGGSEKAGKMSPANLLVTTITDELRSSTNFRSKVIGVSLKDRASILPAGHAANAAYWFDSESGNFMTSTYYLLKLPTWVENFNAEKRASKYLLQPWKTLLPVEHYTESTADNETWEAMLPREKAPIFPHDLPSLKGAGFELIRSTPFGNSLTTDFAIAAIQNEKLGKSNDVDFLTLSFSSTDYVGHLFGPNSVEIEDTYLRLDADLERFLHFLDVYIGKKNVLLFLTADHGVVGIPGFNASHRFPGGVIAPNIEEKFKSLAIKTTGGISPIRAFSNDQLYLDPSSTSFTGTGRKALFESLRNLAIKQPGVADLIDLKDLSSNSVSDSQLPFYKNGYHAKRSGDFQLITEPGWLVGRSKGTTHGTGYAYDTHVPLLWYGWLVKKGASTEKRSICDIAPTLASMLDILEPSGSTGKVIPGILTGQ